MCEWHFQAIVYISEAVTFKLGNFFALVRKDGTMKDATQTIRRILQDEAGQDIAEYAVMLAVILLIVIGTVKLIGSSANSTFSNVASNLSGG